MNEDKILISKIMDKVKFTKHKNIVTNTEFLNEAQIMQVTNELKHLKISNYEFNGGFENAETKVLIIYPENIEEQELNSKMKEIIKAIKVELPSELTGKIQHKNYLGTLMSFGLARERIGDIIVYENSAYILVLNENAEYIKNSLSFEKNFKKAKISIIETDEIVPKEIEFQNITIAVNSLRLDNVISDLINTSRRIAQELLDDEKVSINYETETKYTKTIKERDILIIRGYGKFIIEEFQGKNKKDKEIVTIKKYK